MKFTSTLAAIASLMTFVSADVITLGVKSDNDLNGKALASKHEGAGINDIFFGESAEEVIYESNDNSVYITLNGKYKQAFQVNGNVVQYSVGEPKGQVLFSPEGELLYNGTTENFYACKGLSMYSPDAYVLAYYEEEASGDCESIKVVKN